MKYAFLIRKGTVIRVALAGLLMLAVAVGTLTPQNLNSTTRQISPAPYHTADKRSGEPDAVTPMNNRAVVGRFGELGTPDPTTAAAEDYANRAYPLKEVPVSFSAAARSTFAQIQSRTKGRTAAGTWQLIGPSMAIYPASLNRTPIQYVASGRITALATTQSCTPNNCRLYLAAAGGGVWRTDKALSGNPAWTFVSGSFGSNAIGTLTVDPTDPSGNTVYAGTGEPNASGDSEAGVGIYKTTNGGNTWTLLPGSPAAMLGRSVSAIVIDPTNANTLYVGTARGVRGVSSVTGGATSNPPGAPPFGLYKSTDGGATFSFIWNGNGSVRGVNHVALDPSNPAIIYAAAFQQGIWRNSPTDGGTFKQVFVPQSPLLNTDRTSFALTTKAGHTRIYAGDGAQGPSAGAESQVWRNDNMDQPASVLVVGGANADGWIKLTSSNVADPGYATYDYCTGQCWYDNEVYTPAGHPDTVFVIGSFLYDEAGGLSNARGVLMSTTAGNPDPAHNNRTFTDLTRDASSDTAPNGIHPDQHALAFMPGNPDVWFEGSDGGLVRSSGAYRDISYQCDSRGLPNAAQVTTCKRLLSAVPSHLYVLNQGLSTLQFQSLSANPQDYKNLMGGTQDNGTFEYTGSSVVWPQIIYGDGGQSGFNAANPAIRFNTFFGEATDTNFQNGNPTKWVVTSGPLENSPEGSAFYMPIIPDPNPAKAGSIFAGLQGVWRTTDNGGDQAYLEANCPEFTTSAANPNCGDWVELGGANGDLTRAALGDRAGNVLAAVERAPSDTGTLWAATATGRVFISKNADAAAAGSVTYTRLDSLSTSDPGRFVSSIYIDPANPNHAWISYSGYNAATPTTPGHVFEVTYNAGAGTATWTNLNVEGVNGDLPVTDLVRDDVTGDLYAATDFGVLRRAAGSGAWAVAGSGLPAVEEAGLTNEPQSRILYAATHGRSAWSLRLP
jgi:hypothetical protein